jgi:hypothetical protein
VPLESVRLHFLVAADKMTADVGEIRLHVPTIVVPRILWDGWDTMVPCRCHGSCVRVDAIFGALAGPEASQRSTYVPCENEELTSRHLAD